MIVSHMCRDAPVHTATRTTTSSASDSNTDYSSSHAAGASQPGVYQGDAIGAGNRVLVC